MLTRMNAHHTARCGPSAARAAPPARHVALQRSHAQQQQRTVRARAEPALSAKEQALRELEQFAAANKSNIAAAEAKILQNAKAASPSQQVGALLRMGRSAGTHVQGYGGACRVRRTPIAPPTINVVQLDGCAHPAATDRPTRNPTYPTPPQTLKPHPTHPPPQKAGLEELTVDNFWSTLEASADKLTVVDFYTGALGFCVVVAYAPLCARHMHTGAQLPIHSTPQPTHRRRQSI
jgi:hypothetical protein